MDLVEKVVEHYKNGCSVEIVDVTNWYDDYIEIRACDVEKIEKPSEDEREALKDNIVTRLINVANEYITRIINGAGYKIIDIVFENACVDIEIDVSGVKHIVNWCYREYINTGLGYRTEVIEFPALEDIISDVKQQLEKLEKLDELIGEMPNVAIALALNWIQPTAVVKAFRSGNSVVATIPFRRGERLCRYDISEKLVVFTVCNDDD